MHLPQYLYCKSWPRVGLLSFQLKQLKAMVKKDWFKIKKYPHIGFPLKDSDRYKWIENYILNPENIKKHSFLPFIHKTSKVRKFRKEYSLDNGNCIESENGKSLRISTTKERELYYASHLDSLIFSYYSERLSDKYELIIEKKSLHDVVNAYRSVPIDINNPHKGNKCNIDFANDVFKYIKDYKEQEFVVITFDIKSFFDNLDHKLLRNVWMNILEVDRLPPDHFNVFKNITRYSYVDIVDIFKEFKNVIYTQRKYKNNLYGKIKTKRVSRVKFLRNQDTIAFCTVKEFLKKKNKLLKNSKKVKKDGNLIERNFGIPQGSPISSILANMYLLDFDIEINNLVKNFGIYRRYSDDMIVVCPINLKNNIEDSVYKKIQNFKLEIQESKTQIFYFKKEGERLVCGQEFTSGINWNKNLIYLGFEFDGDTVLLKSASLSTYYRKMCRSINRAKNYSKKRKNKNRGELFRRRIYKKFSILGANRRRKFIYDKNKREFIKSDYYDWGNFLSYARKASEIMITNKIKNQIKNHWKKLNILINE
ncbi:reverse transcriptase domain-containing protein [Chryseobacterium sp. ES2]|uniref:Reverse transcriptase domain-containing protein n=1 Tax=Chryseobacterium metallicongregator TaxID=3073042 RepID=A0ABU1EA54_9FLAO|nr:reverse transcriptase domain-containing protein [Chryseobacterium sp. ES2]MDR4954475.1 reverse transcriptase domain-containing protein [Chryseobacterium sp. ES2]